MIRYHIDNPTMLGTLEFDYIKRGTFLNRFSTKRVRLHLSFKFYFCQFFICLTNLNVMTNKHDHFSMKPISIIHTYLRHYCKLLTLSLYCFFLLLENHEYFISQPIKTLSVTVCTGYGVDWCNRYELIKWELYSGYSWIYVCTSFGNLFRVSQEHNDDNLLYSGTRLALDLHQFSGLYKPRTDKLKEKKWVE